jgi:hypothetical protein
LSPYTLSTRATGGEAARFLKALLDDLAAPH